MLGKNPTSVQNAKTFPQKKDANLCIIGGLHIQDTGHEINNSSNNQNDNQYNIGPYHDCSGPHLVSDCNESIYNRSRPNLHNHTPAKGIRKRSPNMQQKSNSFYNNNSIESQSNGHNNPNVQLPPVSTSKPDHMTKLLEATKKMTKYFEKSYKHNKTHHNSTHSHHQTTTTQLIHTATNANLKTSDQVNEIIGQTYASKTTTSEPEDIKDPHDSDSPDNNLDSSSDSE